MSLKKVSAILLLIGVLCIGVVLGPVLVDAAMAMFAPTPAFASSADQEAPFVPDGIDALTQHTCNIRQLTTGSDGHIQVICWQATTTNLFAFSTTLATGSDNMLATALTAHALGRTVTVFYESTATGLPSGCSAANCHRLDYVRMN